MAMWLILQHHEADDFVVGSGRTRTVREFCEIAFRSVGLPISWRGDDVDEVGYVTETGAVVVRIDPKFYRPAEVDLLHSDPSRIQKVLGWSPETSFDKLVQEMIEEDCKMVAGERTGALLASTATVLEDKRRSRERSAITCTLAGMCQAQDGLRVVLPEGPRS
eukprot:5387927-Pyramimonas_sp.AAC.1